MKKTIMTFALAMSFLSADTIKWENNLDTAIAKAKVEKKNIMIMIESEHCRWCHKMHDTTLNDPKVKNALSYYVAVKMDRDNTILLKSFPAVSGVPTILFVTPQKKILTTSIGYSEPFDFLSDLRDAKKISDKLNHK